MAKRTCEICGRPTDEPEKIAADIEIPGTCLDTTPDWEQRRYEIALALFASPHYLTAEEAVMNADDLIRELQKKP